MTPFFVEDYLMATPEWYGYINGGFAFGGIIGFAIAAGVRVSGPVRSKMCITAVIMLTFLLTLFGFLRVKELAVMNMVMAGIMHGFFNVNLLTILQQTSPNWIRGRVFAVMTTISGALVPVVLGLTGIIVDLLNQNMPLVLIAGGAISAVLCVMLAFSRAFREYMAYEHVPGED